uniref:Uncharacterized protein n=1 Tax=Arundo donax TaxID=35708 RepID=A0A0A9G4L1_ARUDO
MMLWFLFSIVSRCHSVHGC